MKGLRKRLQSQLQVRHEEVRQFAERHPWWGWFAGVAVRQAFGSGVNEALGAVVKVVRHWF